MSGIDGCILLLNVLLVEVNNYYIQSGMPSHPPFSGWACILNKPVCLQNQQLWNLHELRNQVVSPPTMWWRMGNKCHFASFSIIIMLPLVVQICCTFCINSLYIIVCKFYWFMWSCISHPDVNVWESVDNYSYTTSISDAKPLSCMSVQYLEQMTSLTE